MLKNDFRYILKRVIAAILIALILMLIRSKNVYAKELSSHNWGYQYIGATTNSQYSDFTINGNPWANWRLGTLYFTIAVTKTTGSATDPVLGVRSIYAYSDTTVYTCYFGANTSANSTWTETTYSVQCPMDLGWPGVTKVRITFNPIGQQTTSSYIVTLDEYATFEQDDSVTLNVDTSGTTSAINNQITNDNTNTTNIINNQNTNTEKEIESQKVCKMSTISFKDIEISDSYLSSDGSIGTSSNGFGITKFFMISGNSIRVLQPQSSSFAYYCFYTGSKTLISCSLLPSNNNSINVPSSAVYFRSTVNTQTNKPIYEVETCTFGNQAIADGQQQINDTLNNDDVTGASSEAESFFDNFQSDSHGLSGIITAPLRLIQGLASSSCTALSIPLPFVHENATLPCMSSIYSTYFPTFLSLYQLITTGLIGYWVLIKIFGHVKGMQDPTDDRIEVLEL